MEADMFLLTALVILVAGLSYLGLALWVEQHTRPDMHADDWAMEADERCA